MFGMSMTEIVIIAIFALIILGPKELPQVARTVGKTLRDVRKASDDLKETFEREVMQEKPPPLLRPVAEAVAQGANAPAPNASPEGPAPTEPLSSTPAAPGQRGPA
jgi:sec-independent protein translocase protein TatB